MPPSKKLKYFYCPVCNKTETQEWAVAAVQHSHGGKLINCERVQSQKETGSEKGKADGKGLDKEKPTRRNRSKYVDGITGKEIGGAGV